LIEAMGRGNLVLYFDTTENREVCGDTGLAYSDEAGLLVRIEEALGMSDADRAELCARASARARERYDWEVVTTQYEKLLTDLAP
jgi:glycosyltransferase involved in cell wall biosynthesis